MVQNGVTIHISNITHSLKTHFHLSLLMSVLFVIHVCYTSVHPNYKEDIFSLVVVS